MLHLMLVQKEIKDIRACKERPAQYWNKGQGVFRARPHPTDHPACKSKAKVFSAPGKH